MHFTVNWTHVKNKEQKILTVHEIYSDEVPLSIQDVPI